MRRELVAQRSTVVTKGDAVLIEATAAAPLNPAASCESWDSDSWDSQGRMHYHNGQLDEIDYI